MNPLLQHWYFHLPNFVLAAVMYSLLGRLLLSFFVPPGWGNYIWRTFTALTGWAVGLTRALTPAILPDPVVMVFAILWLMLARAALFIAMAHAGLLPGVA